MKGLPVAGDFAVDAVSALCGIFESLIWPYATQVLPTI